MTTVNPIKHQLDPLTDESIVYRTRDEYGDIVVHDIKRGRVLSFGGIAEQSRIDLDDPARLVYEYTQAMLLPLLAIDPAQVTLLGLGGGGLVHSLFHALPGANIDVVELRQAVIDVAYSHFFLPRGERVRVHCADAREYVANAEADSTDLLLCDLYDANKGSVIQLDKTFCRRSKQMLIADGWLVMNYHQLPSIDHPAIRVVCNNFESVFLCMVSSGNWIVLATDSPVVQEGDRWQQMHQPQISLRRQLAFHSYRLIRIE